MDKEQVRGELKRLRQLSQNTDAVCRARKRRQQRLDMLRRGEKGDDVDIFLPYEKEIEALIELEARYIAVGGCFDSTDQAILLDCLIGGKTYRAFGEARGYSAESVRKRAGRIIEELARKL